MTFLDSMNSPYVTEKQLWWVLVKKILNSNVGGGKGCGR